MKKPKYTNDVGGIMLDYADDSGSIYADPGSELHQRAESGEFGAIEPYTPDLDPGPAIPHSVTRRQGRLALLEVGKLDQVEAMIAAIEDPTERRAAEIEYEADTWERSNAFLQAMWAQLGGTESELDALFVLASEK